MTSTDAGTGPEGTSEATRSRPGTLASRRAAVTRILVVEDEHDIADFLRAFFRASGYDLLHVDPSSPRHVLARVHEGRPDCILLDVRLRGFSGFDAYRLIREDRDLDLVPVIVVTADGSAGVRAVGVAGGLDGYIGKPFSVKALEQLVAERVTRARTMRKAGGRDASGTASEAYAQARLRDEVAAALAGGSSVGFALVRLIGLTRARRDVGAEAAAYVEARIRDLLLDRLPTSAVLGTTASSELALILPDLEAHEAEEQVQAVVGTVAAAVALPGGARVTVTAAAGLAVAPEHAGTADELWMAADAALADATDAGGGLVAAR